MKEDRNQILIKLKAKFFDWSGSSSSHGFPNIFKADNNILRISWAISFLCSLGFCSYLIIQSINNYFERNVTTSIRLIPESPMVFPTVTI